MARPSKFTPKRTAIIIQKIGEGNYKETAARSAGICYDTLNEWIKKGNKEKEGKFFEFSEAVEKAEAEAEMVNVKTVTNTAKKDWKAAAWWLAHAHPERWGDTKKVEYSGEIKTELDVSQKQQMEALQAEVEAVCGNDRKLQEKVAKIIYELAVGDN